jgi:cell division protein FtsZ
MLLKTGLINQDFSALRSIFQNHGGKTMFATGSATGEDFVQDALEELFLCPLLHMGDRPANLDRILVNIIGGADLGIAKVNVIMSQVTKRFGSREDIVFGAVIDEARRESLEICILAKAELELASEAGPNPMETNRERATDSEGLGLESQIAMENKPPRAVHQSKLRKKKPAANNQDEFKFDTEAQRGYFDKTERNLYKDEDLDVPTYLRRGIKIKLKA